MTATYYAIPTDVGNAKDANAKALGLARKYVALAIGDGGGDNAAVPTPKPSQKALLGEWRRAPLNSLGTDPKSPSQLIAEQIIPEAEGGKWIRELGLFDEDGDLCYVSNAPPTYKPTLPEGSGKTQSVRMIIISSSGVTVELKIDPSVVLATRSYADNAIAVSMKAHTDADDPHPKYAKKTAVAQSIADALVSHVAEADPHQQYAKKTAVAQSISDAFTAHVGGDDPHSQYAKKASPTFTGKPTAPTPQPLATGKEIATAEFVNLSGLRLSGFHGVVDSVTLTAADATGGGFVSSGSKVMTVTLPEASTMPANALMHFSNAGIYNLTIGRQKSDTFTLISGSGGLSALIVKPGESLLLAMNGQGGYLAIGGSSQLPYSHSFGALLASNGFQRLPSGLLLQMGSAASGPTSGDRVWVPFPVTFPNTVWGVVFGASFSGTSQSSAWWESVTNVGFFGRANMPNTTFNYIAWGL